MDRYAVGMPVFPPTMLLFREDPYRHSTDAVVLGFADDGGVILDRTVFYPAGGGQPGDRGVITTPGGEQGAITAAAWLDPGKTIVVHPLAAPLPGLQPGSAVMLTLEWPVRHARMRMHTALHLLSVALPYPVTGGAIGEEEGRLDFDIPEPPEREAIDAALARMIAADAAVRERWVTDAELDANPGLVKTLSVQPPRGSGRVRLVEIEGLDLQPCGGTHVARTGEIGTVRVSAIEKKGRINRRVRLRFADGSSP